MTQSEVILLALLNEKDYYGYEMESIIDQRNIREWTEIGFSSIYNTLNKLEGKGYIGSRIEKAFGSPKRKVYFIQDSGKELLKQEIARMLAAPAREYSEFNIGMAFSDMLDKAAFKEAVGSYREYLVNRRAHLQKRYEEQPFMKAVPHLNALFTRPMAMLDAEIRWIEDFEKEI